MQIKDVEAGYKHRIIIYQCIVIVIYSLWLLVFLKRKLFTVFTDLQCSDHSKDTDCIKLETKRGDTVWQFQQNGDRLLQRPSGQCEQAGRARWAEEVICQQDRSKFNRWTNTPQSPSAALWCTHIINRPVLSRQSCYPPPPHSHSAPFFAGAFSICDGELQASCLALFLRRLVDWKQQPRRPDDYVLGSPPTILCAPH